MPVAFKREMHQRKLYGKSKYRRKIKNKRPHDTESAQKKRIKRNYRVQHKYNDKCNI